MGSQDNVMNVVTQLYLELLTICAAFQQKCYYLKLTVGCNKFGKKVVQNLRTRVHFFKKLRDQVDKTIDKLYLSKSIPNVCLKSISCQETCKLYLLITAICASKYRSVKMLLLKLGSELPNLFKDIQFTLKIWIKCRLNFHEVECTENNFNNPSQFFLNNSETVKTVNLAFCSTR